MQKVTIFILVSLAVQVQAKRVKVERLNAELEKAEAEQATQAEDDAKEERLAVADPSYWYTHQGQFEFLAPSLMNSQYIQQYELKEDYRLLRTKKYDVKLDQYENENQVEVRKNINQKVLRVENYFFTMHAHQGATFTNEQGTAAGDYIMFNPKFFARHYTWRVAKKDDPSKILFTIQKRLYNDHCKYLNLFSCRPVLKIYVGKKGDKSTLIYYATGDKDLDEPDFKFYHSKEEFTENKGNWAAKVDHKKTKDNGEDKYKVKVKPNEDAALILLASVCLDKVGDDAKVAEEPEGHDD